MNLWRHLQFSVLATLIALILISNGQAEISAYVDDKNGLPIIEDGGKILVTSRYAFWGESWKWAGMPVKLVSIAPTQYRYSGINRKLDFELETHAIRRQSNIKYEIELLANSTIPNVSGGGIIFKLDKTAVINSSAPPELLPNNTGWRWGEIEVKFSPPLASVFFEKRKKFAIRAFLFKGNIKKGKYKTTMSISLPAIANTKPTIHQRFGLAEPTSWIEDKIDFQNFPVNLSFLNKFEKPAGSKGFISVSGDKLVFENGQVAKFWGTNLTAAALFNTSKLNVKKQAKRLSALGFNLVRLHHHDSPWVNPNVFGNKTLQDTQELNKSSLDKLDWWIKCLKDEGIYVWLDLHAQRHLLAKDNIFAFDEIAKKSKHRGADLKGYSYVNLTIKNAMKRFNRAYVNHVNPYTKLAYKNEPAIVVMQLTNENDVTNHFGNRLLPNKHVPQHNEIYMNKAKAFALEHGLSFKKTWHSWEHGPSKLFLNDLEHRLDEDLISDLREAGVKAPIVTTSSWGNNPLASLPALTTGNIIDVHTYGGVLELEKNPRVAAGMTAWMSAGQVANKPMSISEWNVSPFPTPDRHSGPLLVASKASHQGWDMVTHYAYAQNSLDKVGKPSNWHSHNDPSLLASLPAAALLYRNSHVKAANTTYYFSPSVSIFNEKISPKTSVAIRTSSEIGKLLIAMPAVKSLPWLKPSSPPDGAIIIKDHKQSLIESTTSSVTSDTGELHRNWENGTYTINTNQSQAVMGWIGGKTISLAHTEFSITTGNATVVIQCLDNKGISQSKDILISLSSNSIPDKNSKKRNKLPFYSEPIKGTLKIMAPAELHLAYINNLGNKIRVPVNYLNGQYTIELDKLPMVHWLSLSEKN